MASGVAIHAFVTKPQSKRLKIDLNYPLGIWTETIALSLYSTRPAAPC